MPSCCDCFSEEPLIYSVTCNRPQEDKKTGQVKNNIASRAFCIGCANKELKAQGLPQIKEAK